MTGEVKTRPDCYECKHRHNIPGDAHSCCRHPLLGDVTAKPLAQILGMFASVGGVPPMQVGVHRLGIKANRYGIKMGFFNFPFNFDPTWLEECNGFEARLSG